MKIKKSTPTYRVFPLNFEESHCIYIWNLICKFEYVNPIIYRFLNHLIYKMISKIYIMYRVSCIVIRDF